MFGKFSPDSLTNISTILQLGLILGLLVSPQPVESSTVEVPIVQEVETDTVVLIKKHAAKQDVKNVDLLVKIATCESGLSHFDQDGKPLRGVVNSKDVGLFQINEYYHLEKSKELGFDIHTQEGNIQYAVWLFKNEGSTPWNWSKPCWSK